MICPRPPRVDCCIALPRRCPPAPCLIEWRRCPPSWPTPILRLDHAVMRASGVLLRGGVCSGSLVAIFSTSFPAAMVAVSKHEEKKAKLNFSFFSSSLSNRVDCLLIATSSRVDCCTTLLLSTVPPRTSGYLLPPIAVRGSGLHFVTVCRSLDTLVIKINQIRTYLHSSTESIRKAISEYKF